MISVLEAGEMVVRDGNDIAARFSFLREKGHVISLVGGGGKTTWMYALGLCGRSLGHRVLLTTTTHLEKPPGICQRWRAALDSCGDKTAEKGPKRYLEELLNAAPAFCWAQTPEETEEIWSRGRIPVLGADCGDGKLKMVERDTLRKVMDMASLTVVEADGSKGMPCKVPGPSEPVIPQESGIVLGIAGLSALGRPRGEVCFRSTEDGSHLMTACDLAEILSSEQGVRKGVGSRRYYPVLNQCDSEERLREALEIRRRLEKKGCGQVMISSFLPESSLPGNCRENIITAGKT